ncbi:alanine racemase [Alteromonas sp. W364]|uniref:alanine racemase n=1 Tax=Alteromonas sp. W364 TaxID=3075610 RepID=UPI00288807B7|nr:alanine racemase [Alteromonas sp. W364]MDT0628774.1 alanine racemase [Alteromonas sp. W364]
MARYTHARINLDALRYNFTSMSELAPASKQVVVIKANAYGNGAIEVARCLQSEVDLFAVAFLDEVYELREAGITTPILVLQGPHQEQECELSSVLNVVWMLHLERQINWINKRIENREIKANQHWVKFDTGMHRLGLDPSEYDHLAESYPYVFTEDAVIATHLARADEPECENAQDVVNAFLLSMQDKHQNLSIANSAANICLPSAAAVYNRMGISLYGSSPFEKEQVSPDLKPVMTLKSEVIALRDLAAGESVGYGATWTASKPSTIATVAIGYADGYPRHAPIGTPALFNGKKAFLVGRVSMDMLTFDVSGLDDIDIGTEVELWGENLPINEVAAKIGTIGYELMTRVSARVPRKYD